MCNLLQFSDSRFLFIIVVCVDPDYLIKYKLVLYLQTTFRQNTLFIKTKLFIFSFDKLPFVKYMLLKLTYRLIIKKRLIVLQQAVAEKEKEDLITKLKCSQ